MNEKIIRICSWISTVLYSLLSIVSCIILFSENLNISGLITLTMFMAMAYTGWGARKIGIACFKPTKLTKVVAIFSLIFGCSFVFLSPFLLASSYGIGDSYESIIALLVLFLPAIISSVAILIKKFRNENEKY